MKLKIKDCKDKKPTATLLFSTNGVKGHILLDMVDGVVINTKKNIIGILNSDFLGNMKVDKIMHINVNVVFMMFYELIIDYKEELIIINVRRIK